MDHILAVCLEPALGVVDVDLVHHGVTLILVKSPLGVFDCAASDEFLILGGQDAENILILIVIVLANRVTVARGFQYRTYLDVGDINEANVLGGEAIKEFVLTDPLTSIFLRRLDKTKKRAALGSGSSSRTLKADAEKGKSSSVDTHN